MSNQWRILVLFQWHIPNKHVLQEKAQQTEGRQGNRLETSGVKTREGERSPQPEKQRARPISCRLTNGKRGFCDRWCVVLSVYYWKLHFASLLPLNNIFGLSLLSLQPPLLGYIPYLHLRRYLCTISVSEIGISKPSSLCFLSARVLLLKSVPV